MKKSLAFCLIGLACLAGMALAQEEGQEIADDVNEDRRR